MACNVCKREFKTKGGLERHLERAHGRVTDGVNRIPYSPVVPIVVYGKRAVLTYAMLNTGSNLTFCSQELVERLGLEPQEHKKDINTMGKCVGQTYGYLTLEVQSLQEKHIYKFPHVHIYHTLEHLNDSIPRLEDIQHYEHLKDIPIADFKDEPVTMVIGTDNAEVLRILAYKDSDVHGLPLGVKTLFGWTLMG